MDFEKTLNKLFEGTDGEINSGAFESISLEKANETIKKHCSDFEKQQLIFNIVPRSELDSKADYYIYEPLKAKRSYNKLYHVMFMDKSTTWKDFPKRKNAVIAYANKNKITEDGITYIAIPFNKTKLGVCPKELIEDSFNNVSINLGMKFEYFNRSFNILLNIFNNPEGTYESDTKKLHLEDEKFYDESWGELQKAIKTADNAIAKQEGQIILDQIIENPFNKETEANVISIIEYLNAKKISIQDMIDKLFAPTENNFSFMPFTKFVVGENKDKEVWFNNKCILVKESAFDELKIETNDDTNSEQSTDQTTDEPTNDEDPADEPTNDEDIGDETDEEDVDDDVTDEIDSSVEESYLRSMMTYKQLVESKTKK
jgi:hypothetical protein